MLDQSAQRDMTAASGNQRPSVAVLVPGRPQGEYILFVRDRDPARETWDGRRAGPEGAVRDFGADHAFPITDIDEILPGLMENRAKVFYAMGTHPEFDQRVVGWVNGLRTQARNGRHPPQEIVALDHVLHDMRLFKSRAEVDTMREAARIAARAHVRAMHACAPGKHEYEIAAEVVHEFRRHNADTSYLPIVGGGANGCILHYRENDALLRDGDLLLIDAGCEVDCYASDITRTFPVNGRFTPEQLALYQLVLDANYAAIERVKPGNHWNEPHEAAVRVITQGLVKLGLLKGPADLFVVCGFRANEPAKALGQGETDAALAQCVNECLLCLRCFLYAIDKADEFLVRERFLLRLRTGNENKSEGY